MSDALAPGTRVRWNAPGGTAHGKVIRKQTEDTRIKDHQVRASEDEPQYIVRSDKGGTAAHKPSALERE